MNTINTEQPKIIQHDDGSTERQFADGSSSITLSNGESNWTATDGTHGFHDGQGYIEKFSANGDKFWTDEKSGSIGKDFVDGSSEIYNSDGSWTTIDAQGNTETGSNVDYSPVWGDTAADIDLGIKLHSDEEPNSADLSINNSSSIADNSMDNMADALDNDARHSVINEDDLADTSSEHKLDFEDELNEQNSASNDHI